MIGTPGTRSGRHRSSAAVLVFLSLVCRQASADLLTDLPLRWQHRLESVSEVDVSPLKPGDRDALLQSRKKVQELLLAGDADRTGLASAYGKLGSLYLTHNLFTSAQKCYANAIYLQPEYFSWVYYSAYLARESGDIDEAVRLFRRAVELRPEYPAVRYRLADAYVEMKRLDDAARLFHRLLNEPGFQAAAHNGLGQVDLLRRAYRDAAEHFRQALELAPEATEIHYPLAVSLRASGESESARHHLRQYAKGELVIEDPLVEALEELKDPAGRHFAYAMTAVEEGDYAKAVAEFEKGLEYEPGNDAARTSYARVLYLNGDREKARQQLEEVVAHKPEKTLSLFFLALLNDESNKPDAAVDLYRQVIGVDPTHEGAQFYLANHNLRSGKYRSAVQHYETVIQRDDKNLPAHIYRLVALLGAQAPDHEVVSAARDITVRKPDLLSIRRIRILLLALSEDANVRNSTLAKRLAEEAYESAPNPVNLELLALATASAGEYDRAEQQMREAIDAERQYTKSKNVARMERMLALIKKRRLPIPDWSEEIAHMQPPPVNAFALFRDYPDPNPV